MIFFRGKNAYPIKFISVCPLKPSSVGYHCLMDFFNMMLLIALPFEACPEKLRENIIFGTFIFGQAR